MSFVDSILDFFTILFGGLLFIILICATFFCSLSALLAISEENRVLFIRSSKIVGIGVAAFGLLLPFRGVSAFASLLSIAWAAIFFNIIPIFQVVQVAVVSISSLIYWIRYLSQNEVFFLQAIGDVLIFIILPTIFTVVNLSRGAECLSGRDKTSSNGPAIPLKSFLSKCYSFVEKLCPPNA